MDPSVGFWREYEELQRLRQVSFLRHPRLLIQRILSLFPLLQGLIQIHPNPTGPELQTTRVRQGCQAV